MAVVAETLAPPPAPNPRARPGFLSRFVRRVVIPIGILSGIAYGGWWGANYAGLFTKTETETRLLHKVSRGDLIITVVEDGNLESASNIDIRCQVAGGATIKKIVTDGTIVQQGDQLVELDSAAIDEQILTQRIQYEKARAIRDQAVNDLAAAKIGLREYVEGTYLKELQTFESQITIAQENLRSSQNTLDYTERMFRKGYVTPLQQEAQQFAVKKAQLDLDLAETAKKVLREFTFEKMKNELETKVATAEAKAKSEEAAFLLEESKLKRLETQKANCIIFAPQSGMVVYANESGGSRFGGSSDRPRIEEGATVRESQVILRVPDLSQMQVKVTVHETKVESLRRGMPASIRIQNRKSTGYVTTIANQPESASMFAANVREYATYVRIDGVQTDLKPGMTCEVEILIDERKGVLTVPIQCVVEKSGKFYCWRLEGNESIKTEVALGVGDDRHVEVRSGLADGDVVLQNPPERSEGNFGVARDGKQFGAPRKDEAAGPNGGATSGETSSGGSRPRGAGMPSIASLDKDGDKRLSRDEAPEPMKAFFDKLDSDADGFVTEAEAAARRPSSGGGGPPPGAPSGGQP